MAWRRWYRPRPGPRRKALSKQSVLQEMADRAAVELARVAAARPALSTRCERAAGILADHAVSPRRRLIRAQLRGGELVGYLVRGQRRRGLPGRGEGLVALLVPGPSRAAPPAERGFAGVQARAGVLGAVAGGGGGSGPRRRGRRDGDPAWARRARKEAA